jgi:hypothetical protein
MENLLTPKTITSPIYKQFIRAIKLLKNPQKWCLSARRLSIFNQHSQKQMKNQTTVIFGMKFFISKEQIFFQCLEDEKCIFLQKKITTGKSDRASVTNKLLVRQKFY